jgi:hypothetical protein
MFQIVEALTTTLTRFIDNHGPKVALGVLAVIGIGIALKVLHRVVSAGRSNPG